MLQVIRKSPHRKHLEQQSFFLASPGDLAAERSQLYVRLQQDLRSQGYDAYAYEYDPDLGFQAAQTYQDQIPYPSDPLANVTICLLGEKLGSGVGDAFRLSDGFAAWLAQWQEPLGSPIALPDERLGRGGRTIPLTGTLFELLDALRAAEPGSGREVWIFAKGKKPHTLPHGTWSANPTLGKVDLVRNFGLNAYHTRLTETAKSLSPHTAEAQDYLRNHYDEQLSYLDAVLRILRDKSRHVETFESTQDLIGKVGQKARSFFRDRAPAGGAPWWPSLEPIDAQHHQSLFGREEDVLSICNGLIRLSLPDVAGRPWYVLHGVSGSGKSSVARGGVAAKFRGGFHNIEVTTLETSPSDLLHDATRPPVLELARRIRSELGNPGFPTKDDQDRWDRCIDQREQADAREVARLVLSLVQVASRQKQRCVLVVMDQAEEWWDGDGKFIDRAMLVFLDHVTRSKAVWCLTVLQSEPTGREQGRASPYFGGRLGSLTGIAEFKAACAAGDVEIQGPLGPPDSRGRIREIVYGVVKEQIGVVPEGLDALLDGVDVLRERNVPFLPLLALRLKRICEDLRAQSLAAPSAQSRSGRTGAAHRDAADDPFRDAGAEGTRLAVAAWMTEDILGELDQLGEAAIADIASLVPDQDALDAALDLCLTSLIDVGVPDDEGAEGPPLRSDQCLARDAVPGDFGAPDTPERLLYDTLLRHRLIRFAGSKNVRLTHISVVDHWGRAQQWFDKTANRRNAMNRVAGLIEDGNTVAAIAANLESADNWNAVREVLHHVARRSLLVPPEIDKRRDVLLEGYTAAFEALRDISGRNQRLTLALDAGFDELVDRLLAAPGTMAALDADTGAHGAEPLLVRLTRAGRLDLAVRGAKEGCRRTAMSPQTGDSVFSVLLHRAEHDEENALRTMGVLLNGDPSDRDGKKLRPRPMDGGQRAEILAARTEQGRRSLLDLAARSGSPKAIRVVLHLAADDEARRRLLDPLTDYTKRGFESPLLLAVASGKVPAATEVLKEARRLLGKRALRRHVNSMPVRSGTVQRREPPIVAAARNGNADMVRLLLEHGADPTRAASDLSDAFQAALLNDDTKVLDVLLSSTFRPPPSGVGFALGHWAAVLNARACLLRLATPGKKAWARDALGRTPLHIACARSQPEVLKALLDSLPKDERARRLAEFDDRGRNGLTTALSAGRLDVAEHLLKIPGVAAAVNAPDPEGYRPLHYAVRFCGLEGIALLRAKGAETEFGIEGGAQVTPLQIAAMIDDAAACELLLTEHSLAQVNPHGRTALHYAARYGSAQALRRLLAAPNAPVHAVNAEGQTALHLAAFYGHEECVALLLEQDAGKAFIDAVDAQPDGKPLGGRTALWSASSAGHAGIVRLLVAKDADVERMSANHLRPIDEACRRGRGEAVRTLLEAGARPDAGRLDLTPLHHACRGGHSTCFDVLAAWMEEREGPNALGRALAARTQFGDTPLQMLGKALVRATRPQQLARPLAEDADLEPEGEDESAEREEAVDEKRAGEKPWEKGAPAMNVDLAGAAGIVKTALLAAHDAFDEETISDLAIGCAMLGDVAVIEALRKAGVRFDAIRDQFGATPLHMAAKAGALGVLEALIEARADVNARAADGSPPLHNVVLYADAEALREVIDIFARTGAAPRDLVNAGDVFGETALHKVAACKSTYLVEKMEILCAAGADINRTNAEGETPRGVLAFARKVLAMAGQDDLEAEIELLDQRMEAHGGRIVERPPEEARLPRVGFPLHAMIAARQWELIPKIQRFTPVPCLAATDPHGRTPAMMLASADWSDADGRCVAVFFDWLLSRSGELNACDASGRTLAHYACLATRRDGKRTAGIDTALKHLPQAVVLSARDGLGRTPLHVAAAVGNTAAVRWLLEQGQDAGAIDEFGNAPLHLAAQHGYWRTFDALSGQPGQAQLGANAVGLTALAIRDLKQQVLPDTAHGPKAVALVPGGRERRGSAVRMLLWLLAVAAVAAAGAVWVFGPDLLPSLLPSR